MPQLDLYIQSANIFHLNVFFIGLYSFGLLNFLVQLFFKFYFLNFISILQDYFDNYNLEIDFFNFSSYINDVHLILDKKQSLLLIFKTLIFEIFQYERINFLYSEFKFLFLISEFIVLKLQ